MLKISKKSEYGIIALRHMMNFPKGTVTTAKEIAAQYNIPMQIMAKIMQVLVRHGMVESCQGKRGGYILTRAGNTISLSDIIESIEGPLGIVNCMTTAECDCMQHKNCNISDPFRVIQKQFKHFLAGISLADLDNEIHMQRVAWH